MRKRGQNSIMYLSRSRQNTVRLGQQVRVRGNFSYNWLQSHRCQRKLLESAGKVFVYKCSFPLCRLKKTHLGTCLPTGGIQVEMPGMGQSIKNPRNLDNLSLSLLCSIVPLDHACDTLGFFNQAQGTPLPCAWLILPNSMVLMPSRDCPGSTAILVSFWIASARFS